MCGLTCACVFGYVCVCFGVCVCMCGHVCVCTCVCYWCSDHYKIFGQIVSFNCDILVKTFDWILLTMMSWLKNLLQPFDHNIFINYLTALFNWVENITLLRNYWLKCKTCRCSIILILIYSYWYWDQWTWLKILTLVKNCFQLRHLKSYSTDFSLTGTS